MERDLSRERESRRQRNSRERGEMMRKCGGTAAVAVLDTAAVGAMTRGRASTTASSAGATASAGRAKRRKVGGNESEPLKRSSNSSACTQLRSSTGRRNPASSPPVRIAVSESLRVMSTSLEDQAPVSCCSSYGSSETEKDKLRFADLEQEDCSEADSLETCFSQERSEKTPSSEVGEEEEEEEEEEEVTMNSSEAKGMKRNPPRRSQEPDQSSLDADFNGLFGRIGKPVIKRPSDTEIQEFFAAAEADNLLELERFKNKYNFDFIKEKPLKGRFVWNQISPVEKLIEYS